MRSEEGEEREGEGEEEEEDKHTWWRTHAGAQEKGDKKRSAERNQQALIVAQLKGPSVACGSNTGEQEVSEVKLSLAKGEERCFVKCLNVCLFVSQYIDQ